MIKQKYAPHLMAVGALFTLGNAIILTSAFNFLELGLSLVLTFVTICVVNFLLKIAKDKNLVFCVVSAVVVIAAGSGAVISFLDYIFFLKAEQMPQGQTIGMVIVFAAACIYFSTRHTRAIYKYCLFLAVLTIVIMLLCFVGGIAKLDFGGFSEGGWKNSSFIKNYLSFFSSAIALPFFLRLENQTLKPITLGVAAGFLLLFVAALQAALTLGVNFDIAYPYLNSVSVISSGSLFTRLDGLVWFFFFMVSSVKISICMKVLFESAKQFLARFIYKQKAL